LGTCCGFWYGFALAKFSNVLSHSPFIVV